MSDITISLQQQINAARKAGTALHISGGNSKPRYGRPLSLERLDMLPHKGVIDYRPEELVITARAGTRLSELNALMAEHGQMLAGEPAIFGGQATIGGTVASNLSGPGRPWYGSIRDSLLGLTLLTGDAQQLRFGGRVIKNVAGYDVSRLQCGALGCLGVITEVSLKVIPRPVCSATLLQPINDAQDALQHMQDISQEFQSITGNCWIDGIHYVRFEGLEKTVAAARASYSQRYGAAADVEDSDSLWASIGEHGHASFCQGLPLWRIHLHPTLPALIDGFTPIGIDWAGGLRWVTSDRTSLTQINSALSGVGQACLMNGAKDGEEVFPSIDGPLKDIYLNLKSTFDPDSVLNPGRLYSWL